MTPPSMRLSLSRIAFVVAVPVVAAAERAPNVGAERFRLRWTAESGCAVEGDVGAQALRLLGASRVDPKAQPLAVDARVSSTPGGFLLTLALGEGAQTRTRFLTAPSCEELTHAAALVIALAVDPALDAGATHGPTGTSSAPPTATPTPSPTVASVDSTAQPPRNVEPSSAFGTTPCPRCNACPPLLKEPDARGAPSAGLLLGAGLAFGALPQPLPRPSLGAAYRAGPHWLEAQLSYASASIGPRSDQSGATFQQWLFTPRYCLRASLGPGRLGGCASVEAGFERTKGIGLPTTSTHWSGWAAPALGMQFGHPLRGNSELVLNADLSVPLSRTSFQLDEVEVFRAWQLVPSIRVGALLNWL